MRQAGRYLPEYRALRAKVDFATLTRTPELAAEVTLQPLRRFELDAAILFSDIMTPLQGMGMDLTFEPGPVVREPIRTDAQIDALPRAGAGARRAVRARDDPPGARQRAARRAAHRLRRRAVHALVLPGVRQALEGVRRRRAPSCMRARSPRSACSRTSPMRWPSTCSAQAAAGAQALMLFESWAGLLAPPSSRTSRSPAVRRTAAAAAPHRRAAHLLREPGLGAHAGRGGSRCGRDRRRLAHPLGRGARDPRTGQGGAGQSRSGGAVCRAA